MNEKIIESRVSCYGETPHVLVPEIKLRDGAGLYRFENRNGIKCSAIHKDGEEEWWDYRERESQMVENWNKER